MFDIYPEKDNDRITIDVQFDPVELARYYEQKTGAAALDNNGALKKAAMMYMPLMVWRGKNPQDGMMIPQGEADEDLPDNTLRVMIFADYYDLISQDECVVSVTPANVPETLYLMPGQGSVAESLQIEQ